jgi:hypothetical protein
MAAPLALTFTAACGGRASTLTLPFQSPASGSRCSLLMKLGMIIKTNMTIPYTSVFLELDCSYSNRDAECRLRAAMDRHLVRQGFPSLRVPESRICRRCKKNPTQGRSARLFSPGNTLPFVLVPTIFALGIKVLGPNTKLGGSIIIMAIIGGLYSYYWIGVPDQPKNGNGPARSAVLLRIHRLLQLHWLEGAFSGGAGPCRAIGTQSRMRSFERCRSCRIYDCLEIK